MWSCSIKTPVMEWEETKGQRGANGVGFVDESEQRLTDWVQQLFQSKRKNQTRTWETLRFFSHQRPLIELITPHLLLQNQHSCYLLLSVILLCKCVYTTDIFIRFSEHSPTLCAFTFLFRSGTIYLQKPCTHWGSVSMLTAILCVAVPA